MQQCIPLPSLYTRPFHRRRTSHCQVIVYGSPSKFMFARQEAVVGPPRFLITRREFPRIQKSVLFLCIVMQIQARWKASMSFPTSTPFCTHFFPITFVPTCPAPVKNPLLDLDISRIKMKPALLLLVFPSPKRNGEAILFPRMSASRKTITCHCCRARLRAAILFTTIRYHAIFSNFTSNQATRSSPARVISTNTIPNLQFASALFTGFFEVIINPQLLETASRGKCRKVFSPKTQNDEGKH